MSNKRRFEIRILVETPTSNSPLSHNIGAELTGTYDTKWTLDPFKGSRIGLFTVSACQEDNRLLTDPSCSYKKHLPKEGVVTEYIDIPSLYHFVVRPLFLELSVSSTDLK